MIASFCAALHLVMLPVQDLTPAPERWIGTWAAAAQPALPATLLTVRNRTLRLIVHSSVGGARARIRISNVFGTSPLVIGSARLARRSAAATIEPGSDRALTFGGRTQVIVPAGVTLVSDPVSIAVAPLSDLAISLFLPDSTAATTSHLLARQTSYLSDSGDFTARDSLPGAKALRSWPFLTGVDVAGASRSSTIVAFGNSTTDGDGSTADANRRYPDVLAQRLQRADPALRELGVVNEGIIGNRLLAGSPRAMAAVFGEALGPSGIDRFDRDVLSQPGVRYVIVAQGLNDIMFPGAFDTATNAVTPAALVVGYQRLIDRAHRRGVLVIGTTIPPFEGAGFNNPPARFFSPAKERVRQQVNAWIRGARHQFDGIVDFDAVVRDPARPARLLPAYDSGDHLHPNDDGYAASASAIPLALFRHR